MVFPVVIYGCESWTIKKAECWRMDALNCGFGEDSWELDCKEVKLVNPTQSWIFIGRTDAEAKASILCPPDLKNWLIGKDPDAGKDWKQEEKGWQRMRWLDGITNSMDEFEYTPGVGDGQRSLACCHPWDYKESDTTEWLNWRLNILKSILNTLIK